MIVAYILVEPEADEDFRFGQDACQSSILNAGWAETLKSISTPRGTQVLYDLACATTTGYGDKDMMYRLAKRERVVSFARGWMNYLSTYAETNGETFKRELEAACGTAEASADAAWEAPVDPVSVTKH